jgi:ABC-type multidrug transport system ATPase subunit
MSAATAGAPDVEPAIRVAGLKKSYKELHVLQGVDFEVAPGSIFALLGSNGAGKTTIVRILSTLLRADAGTAEVNGFDVATDPIEVRESISLTGQFAAVDEVLSGRENLLLVATSKPFTSAVPASALSSVDRMRTIVVFPAPFDPRRAKMLPGATSKSTPWRTCSSL